MNTRAWFYLLIGGILEIGWAIGLKFSEGFTLLIPSAFTILILIISFYFVATAMKTIPIGIAYAVFTGIGTAGTAIAGMLFFREPINFIRIMFILLLIGGIIGLKITSSNEVGSSTSKG